MTIFISTRIFSFIFILLFRKYGSHILLHEMNVRIRYISACMLGIYMYTGKITKLSDIVKYII
jgi:hypothetical protein